MKKHLVLLIAISALMLSSCSTNSEDSLPNPLENPSQSAQESTESVESEDSTPNSKTESAKEDANWCSTCKIARDNIESNLNSIPSDLTIVVVDFDKENDLRKKYGVTIQHTFVQIDENGNELAKWSGSITAEEIAEKTI